MTTGDNQNFYDLPPELRAELMQQAAERGGVEDFFDLPLEARAAVYSGGADYTEGA
jgi:hypothetical protein